jgi:hypothetical protein
MVRKIGLPPNGSTMGKSPLMNRNRFFANSIMEFTQACLARDGVAAMKRQQRTKSIAKNCGCGRTHGHMVHATCVSWYSGLPFIRDKVLSIDEK